MAKLIFGLYEESTSLKLQGTRKEIEKYLRGGYKVHSEKNNFWILYKPARVRMKFEYDGKTYEFNMKIEACKYAGKSRISEKTALAFINAVKDGKIKVKICPEDGTYTIQEVR